VGRIQPSADVDDGAVIADSSTVWHLGQVRGGARIGENCVIGRGAYIGSGVIVGDNCKIQNYALLYEPAVLGEGVFIGPAAVLTNDRAPRAVSPNGTLKSDADWDRVGVRIGNGASIGARVVCVAPVAIGEWAMIAAGSVVTRDVPPYALVMGTPARQVGWVGRAGLRLEEFADGQFACPETGEVYTQVNGDLR
jgi:UDP-2-acetamido-3-amino-2,3-dideoxy-glucuronate N-acetyltransferase